MKTRHLTKVTGAGLAFIATGLFLLGISFHLYEIDLRFDEKMRGTPTNPAYMGPIHLPPYYFLQPTLTEIGTVLIGMGFFLLLYKKIRGKVQTKSTRKF